MPANAPSGDGATGGASKGAPRPFHRIGFTLRFFSCVVLLLAACAPAAQREPPRPAASRRAVALDRETTAFLEDLEHRTFRWFWDLADPVTGLVPDRAPTPSFSSVAAVGFGLTAYTIGAERGWVSRAEAADRVERTLRFLLHAPQGDAPSGRTSYHGFFYHFLDMHSGLRFEHIELSTIDTTLLAAGALTCESYFDRDDPTEARIRADADTLYRRIEWDWAAVRPPGISMGWTPEEGFHTWNWEGYNESMIVYVMALGSPTHPVDPAAWGEWTHSYTWGNYYGQAHVNFSPLFGHQYSHVWIDFRGIQDEYMRGKGIDYFENSRRATLSQQAYAAANPAGWDGYGEKVWGISACDGPLDGTVTVAGRPRKFQTYAPRGASLVYVIDDGTIAPTAAAGSVPFAPEIAIPALREMTRRWADNLSNQYGFLDAFNPTLRDAGVAPRHGKIVPGIGWFDTDQLGIDQGPIVAMIENYRSELVWKILRRNPYIIAGLKRAGFTGGWLDRPAR